MRVEDLNNVRRRWRILRLGFLIVYLITSFGPVSMKAQSITASSRIPLVKNSELKSFKLQQGVFDTSFRLSNNGLWQMALQVPEIEEGKNYRLVLALHWYGFHNTYKEFAECLAFPAFDSLNAIIIAPACLGENWLAPRALTSTIDLVRKVNKIWPINPDEIIVTGYSNGGIGAWVYAEKYPKLFSRAICIAGMYRAAEMNVPVHVIHGSSDELFPESEVKEIIEKSRALGSDISYQKVEGFSHYDACRYEEILTEQVRQIFR